ncbi:MAG: calcium/sodium antiporter [gamma proteobacterium symbiont of Bathyaustriella thionipta]|nr:calcium/sodium antiporter [gamma proteobacterium symbiont of Bathyaustriella thionipta]
MLLNILAIVGGFVILIWGADRFVAGASSLARHLGVSPMIIGLTIVGIGTSAPEMLVSGIAAATGSRDIGIGNALGSNITNIALILGFTAIVVPLTVRSAMLKREYPMLMGLNLLVVAILADGYLGRVEGLILLCGFPLMLWWLASAGKNSETSDPLADEFNESISEQMSKARSWFWTLFGLLLLLGSSRLLVWGAANIAREFHISELVIGLTIIAIGTSLPELAASLVSALKKEYDIAIGNVIGSNMFNLLGVLGLPGLIAPGRLQPEVLTRDIPVMIGLTLALFIFGFGMKGDGRINRFEGAILVVAFCVYQYWLFTHAQLPGKG